MSNAKELIEKYGLEWIYYESEYPGGPREKVKIENYIARRKKTRMSNDGMVFQILLSEAFAIKNIALFQKKLDLKEKLDAISEELTEGTIVLVYNIARGGFSVSGNQKRVVSSIMRSEEKVSELVPEYTLKIMFDKSGDTYPEKRKAIEEKIGKICDEVEEKLQLFEKEFRDAFAAEESVI